MTKNKQISLKGSADIALQNAGDLLAITDKIIARRSMSLINSDAWLDELIAWADEDEISEEELASLKSKVGRSNVDSDPAMLKAGITIAGYNIERGIRDFAAYSEAIIDILGENARPYLRTWYEGVRHYPGFDSAGMTSSEEIDKADAVELFGETAKLSSGLSFDEDTYKKALPYFLVLLESFTVAGKTLYEYVKFIIDNFGSDINPKPYLIQFAKDVESGKVIVKGKSQTKEEKNEHEEMEEGGTRKVGDQLELELEQPGSEENGEDMEDGI